LVYNFKKMTKFHLIIVLLLGSCASGTSDTTTNDATATTDAVEASSKENMKVEVGDDFQDLALDGLLDNKYPIFMQLDRVGSSIYGEMLYKKIGKPISVSGSANNIGEWILTEKDDNDQATGVFEGVFANNEFKGKWTNPKTGKSLSFQLSVSQTAIDTYKKDLVSDENVEIGQKYSDGNSDFTFEKINEKEYLFSFLGTWEGKSSANTGELEGVATFKNGKLYFQGAKEDGVGNCAFEAVFKGNKMFLKSKSNDVDCGFGANVAFGTEYTKE
jgi:hypothetical protein